MDRLESVRQVVDGVLRQQPDEHQRRCGFVHLYGVSAICVELALKRRLDPDLCAVAGMLHDISSYKTGDPTDHGRRSALESKKILRELGSFTADEIATVYAAIAQHRDKSTVGDAIAEMLKDADVLQHYLYNPASPTDLSEQRRLKKVLDELGLRRALP